MTTITTVTIINERRPTSNAIRCNDDDERQRGRPLNWYHVLIGISEFYLLSVYRPVYRLQNYHFDIPSNGYFSFPLPPPSCFKNMYKYFDIFETWLLYFLLRLQNSRNGVVGSSRQRVRGYPDRIPSRWVLNGSKLSFNTSPEEVLSPLEGISVWIRTREQHRNTLPFANVSPSLYFYHPPRLAPRQSMFVARPPRAANKIEANRSASP